MSNPKKPYDHKQRVMEIYRGFSLNNPFDVNHRNLLNRLEEEVAFAEQDGSDEADIASTHIIMGVTADRMGDNERFLFYINKGLRYKNISDSVRIALYYKQASAYNNDGRLEEAVKSMHNAFVCSIQSGDEENTEAICLQIDEFHKKYLIIPKEPTSGGTYGFNMDFEVHPRP